MSTKIVINDIDITDTIYTLKQKVHEKTGIPIHQQIFVCNGKLLNDQNNLYDYTIKSGDTIILVVQTTFVPNSKPYKNNII